MQTWLTEQPPMIDCACNGFWAGVWHGIISPITAIATAIDSDYVIYAANGNDAYLYGFITGSAAIFVSIAIKLCK